MEIKISTERNERPCTAKCYLEPTLSKHQVLADVTEGTLSSVTVGRQGGQLIDE